MKTVYTKGEDKEVDAILEDNQRKADGFARRSGEIFKKMRELTEELNVMQESSSELASAMWVKLVARLKTLDRIPQSYNACDPKQDLSLDIDIENTTIRLVTYAEAIREVEAKLTRVKDRACSEEEVH